MYIPDVGKENKLELFLYQTIAPVFSSELRQHRAREYFQFVILSRFFSFEIEKPTFTEQISAI